MTLADAAPAADQTDATAASWHLRTRTGVTLALPPTVRSLSTFVLLEQERWFEPEMSLLPHLLLPGANALDIGANHGVYALEMARLSRHGRVWAFEPTAAPRGRLLQSVALNGFEERVTVVGVALADGEGTVRFGVHDNSELNARGMPASRHEDVQQTTLDGWMQRQAVDAPIALVKLDAEGDELRVLAGASGFFARQSPVVLFEFKNGSERNDALPQAWHALGFDIFRWSAELELLLPFDAALDETSFALNLVAVRPAQQRELAGRGLLVTAAARAAAVLPAPALQPLAALCASTALLRVQVPQPQALRDEIEAVAGAPYAAALVALAQAHLQPGLSAAERALLVLDARDRLLAETQRDEAALAPLALLVHCLHALGGQRAAVEAAATLLRRWTPGQEPGVPVIPPLRADLQRARSTPAGSWLRQVISEFAAMRKAYSSYFPPPEPALWQALLDHPDHDAEVERRYLLAHIRQDRAAEVAALTRLPDERHTCNPAIWRGLVEAMRRMRHEPDRELAVGRPGPQAGAA